MYCFHFEMDRTPDRYAKSNSPFVKTEKPSCRISCVGWNSALAEK